MAHEDDPERATRQGSNLSRRWPRSSRRAPRRLQMRVAVATGLVVVGDAMESGSASKSGIVGETPDLAARLLDRAEPGTVIVAESTRAARRRAFRARKHGCRRPHRGSRPQCARGRRIRSGSAEGRFAAFPAAGLTALVGRQKRSIYWFAAGRQRPCRRRPGRAALWPSRNRQVTACSCADGASCRRVARTVALFLPFPAQRERLSSVHPHTDGTGGRDQAR